MFKLIPPDIWRRSTRASSKDITGISRWSSINLSHRRNLSTSSPLFNSEHHPTFRTASTSSLRPPSKTKLAAITSSSNLDTPNTKSYSTSPTMPTSPNPNTNPKDKIHILGLGNLGRLYAHALATLPSPPPITLLLHRPSLSIEWINSGKKITLAIPTGIQTSSNYDIEVLSSDSPPEEPIYSLIIATKAINTLEALEKVKHRLGAESTILFTQNGMGTTEEVTSKLFPDPETRPTYQSAITSHGVYSVSPFYSVFAGQADISIGLSPGQDFKKINVAQSEYLSNLVTSSKMLNASPVDTQELLVRQLEKLVVNAVINPLTVIFNCKNGIVFSDWEFLYNTHELAHYLVNEAEEVILSLPEFQNASESEKRRFSTKALLKRVEDVAAKTAENTSSMLQDVQAGRKTEIGYINGYFDTRAKALFGEGARCHGTTCKIVEEIALAVAEGRERRSVESCLELYGGEKLENRDTHGDSF
ncbi:ketopantoate reductase PanE/ApbA C terminal-domain-containing protein [Halenospora varia]|nr:ketopantoate reductase PanE/ApbA C terminal-domain-containing protein [Halenospora varia]